MFENYHPIYQAIKFNNVAVHKTVAGCADEEIVVNLFQKALVLISTYCQSLAPVDSSSDATLSARVIASKRALPTLCCEEGRFLFQNLITFAAPKSQEYDNAASCQLLESCIHLNIAIVVHRNALTLLKYNTEEACLHQAGKFHQRAGKFYQKAWQLASSSQGEERARHTVLLVQLVAANNLSQIRWQRGDSPHEATGEVMRLLFDQLVMKSPSASFANEERECLLTMQELKAMLSNFTKE